MRRAVSFQFPAKMLIGLLPVISFIASAMQPAAAGWKCRVLRAV
jgi:hypothetical protein